jgi:tetratricopeptide (TPR) repeat protein
MHRKAYFVILIILFKSATTFSIEFIYPDSVKTDIQQINWLISKGKASLFTNLDSAAIYADEAFRLHNEMEADTLLGRLCQLQGSIELYRGNNKKAIQYYEKGYQFFLKKNDLIGLCTVIYDMGIIYFNSSQFDMALEKDMEALEYAQKIPDSVLISDCYSSISFVYSEKKNYTKALEFLTNSLAIDKKLNYTIGLAYSYSNIADIYEKLEILDSVPKNRYRSLKLFKQLNNDQGLAMCYNGLGSYFFTVNKFDHALRYYDLSLKLREKVGDMMGQALTLNAQAKVQLAYNHLAQAEKNAKRALQIASKIDGLNEAQAANKILSEIAYKRNNFKEAYRYYIEYTQLKDSIFSKDNMNKMAELEAKYENAKKLGQIETLKKENEIKALKLSKERIVRNTLIIIGLLTVFLAVILFSKNRY